MGTLWVQLAATDPGMTAGILMVACRHLTTMHRPEIYRTLALKYKTELISQLNKAIGREQREKSEISVTTITKTLALASDAVCTTSGSCAIHGGVAAC